METLRLKFYALTEEQIKIIRKTLLLSNTPSFDEWSGINSALKYPSVGMQTVMEENLQLRNRIQALELEIEANKLEKEEKLRKEKADENIGKLEDIEFEVMY